MSRPAWYASWPPSDRAVPAGPAASASDPTSGPHIAAQWPNPMVNPAASAAPRVARVTAPIRHSPSRTASAARRAAAPSRTVNVATQSRRPLGQRTSTAVPA